MSLEQKLSAYKVDRAYSHGVPIVIDRAPDVTFVVKLPGPHNRGFMAAVYGSIDLEIDVDEEDVPRKTMERISSSQAVKFDNARRDAFVSYCMVSIDGEPVPRDFADMYPEALSELIAKADEAVAQLEQRTEAEAKKPVPTSHGCANGATG